MVLTNLPLIVNSLEGLRLQHLNGFFSPLVETDVCVTPLCTLQWQSQLVHVQKLIIMPWKFTELGAVATRPFGYPNFGPVNKLRLRLIGL